MQMQCSGKKSSYPLSASASGFLRQQRITTPFLLQPINKLLRRARDHLRWRPREFRAWALCSEVQSIIERILFTSTLALPPVSHSVHSLAMASWIYIERGILKGYPHQTRIGIRPPQLTKWIDVEMHGNSSTQFVSGVVALDAAGHWECFFALFARRCLVREFILPICMNTLMVTNVQSQTVVGLCNQQSCWKSFSTKEQTHFWKNFVGRKGEAQILKLAVPSWRRVQMKMVRRSPYPSFVSCSWAQSMHVDSTGKKYASQDVSPAGKSVQTENDPDGFSRIRAVYLSPTFPRNWAVASCVRGRETREISSMSIAVPRKNFHEAADIWWIYRSCMPMQWPASLPKQWHWKTCGPKQRHSSLMQLFRTITVLSVFLVGTKGNSKSIDTKFLLRVCSHQKNRNEHVPWTDDPIFQNGLRPESNIFQTAITRYCFQRLKSEIYTKQPQTTWRFALKSHHC